MSARNRLVCHKCRVRLELGYNRVDVDYEAMERFFDKLCDLVEFVREADVEEREDRDILWGKLMELRKSTFPATGTFGWPSGELLIKVLAFLLMHPHRDQVELVSEYDECRYGKTDGYEEVGRI